MFKAISGNKTELPSFNLFIEHTVECVCFETVERSDPTTKAGTNV